MDFLGSTAFFCPSTQMAPNTPKNQDWFEKAHEFLAHGRSKWLRFQSPDRYRFDCCTGLNYRKEGLSLGRMYISKQFPKWREQNCENQTCSFWTNVFPASGNCRLFWMVLHLPICHTIHATVIFTYGCHKHQPNVGRYIIHALMLQSLLQRYT